MNQTVSIVIRTMPGREHFLDKCLFILSGQQYQDLEPIVVAQCKTDSESVEKIDVLIAKWKKHFPKISFLHHISDTDARAKSLNMGMKYASGRYLAFLDDDDKVYPHHYQQMVQALQKSKFSWVYCEIVRADFNKDGQLVSRSYPFRRGDYSFHDHIRGNFIPIHAFVVDRERAKDIGFVNETLCKNEDYDFLLRLAFKYEPLHIPNYSAEYCIRSDGTNTVLSHGTLTHTEAVQKRQEWAEADKQLYQLKTEQFGWWIKEIDTVSISNLSSNDVGDHASAQHYLLKIYHSYTWKIIRLGKKINWFFRGRPKKKNSIPGSESLARVELLKVVFSPAWLILSPLYCVEQFLKKMLKK